MKEKIFRIIILIWIMLWLVFTARELFWKNNLNDYKVLISRSLDGKRSYVTGDRLYEFITFCSSRLPAGATYNFAGIKEGSIEQRRAVYYLYPHIQNNDPEFLLVFDAGGILHKDRYLPYEKLDEQRYILKRKGL